MARELGIVPLRSLIAVADAGGFHEAAAGLQLSQSAVSQHIRRLERALGRPVVEPDGRRARLTAAGAALLEEARKIIAVHDEALRRLGAVTAAVTREFVIGTTDHAADHIVPPLVAALSAASPELDVKFRFDRTTALNEAVDRGSVDLAVFITEASAREGTRVGALPLVWCAAPGWAPPTAGQPWPLVAIEAPCAIRGKALAALDEHGIRNRVVAEAAYLAGVMNAARAGLGLALLALPGPPPDGLVEIGGLPAATPIGLTARIRPGADQQAAKVALRVLHATLAPSSAGPAGSALAGAGAEAGTAAGGVLASR